MNFGVIADRCMKYTVLLSLAVVCYLHTVCATEDIIMSDGLSHDQFQAVSAGDYLYNR